MKSQSCLVTYIRSPKYVGRVASSVQQPNYSPRFRWFPLAGCLHLQKLLPRLRLRPWLSVRAQGCPVSVSVFQDSVVVPKRSGLYCVKDRVGPNIFGAQDTNLLSLNHPLTSIGHLIWLCGFVCCHFINLFDIRQLRCDAWFVHTLTKDNTDKNIKTWCITQFTPRKKWEECSSDFYLFFVSFSC